MVVRSCCQMHKSLRLCLSLGHLVQYQSDLAFLSRLVTGDETLCCLFELETKHSMRWKHPASPPCKKFKAAPQSGKLLLTVFVDKRGVLVLDFLLKRGTINSTLYCQALQWLRTAIKNKRCGILSSSIMLLHDNAQWHISCETTTLLRKFWWEVLQYMPYSLDMLPCDYHLFSPLKKCLRGWRFPSEAELRDCVTNWLLSQHRDFF